MSPLLCWINSLLVVEKKLKLKGVGHFILQHSHPKLEWTVVNCPQHCRGEAGEAEAPSSASAPSKGSLNE